MTSFSGESPPPTTPDAEIPQFDVVSDTSDHHFAGKLSKISSSTSSSSSHKKIMQEWKLLSKELPETIFVRVYETRVDLLRAAIVGARGTPYHDGLFFFDIAFPSNYPTNPPLVHYHSFGYRINPNLYNSGRVCLSLLNTWTGKKCEKWDPKKSTILQILLSIQALVLNERPYFNEPGYSSWAGRTYWEKKSSAYNEDVFVLTCRTMLRVLRRPPKNFEPVVDQHFKDRAESILAACEAYRKGYVKVGLFDGNLEKEKGEVSVKFKGAMDQLYADLVLAMTQDGATSLGHLVEQVKEEKEQKAKEKAVAVTKKKGGVNVREAGKSVVKKLKKIVFRGLRKENTNENSQQFIVA